MNPTRTHYEKEAEVAALVKALRETVLQLDYLHDKFRPTGSGNAVIARARALLARYEGVKHG